MIDRMTINKVFDTENFAVLTSCDTPEYIWIDVKEKDASIQIKLDEEGIVVDIFGQDDSDPAVGTWATWGELENW